MKCEEMLLRHLKNINIKYSYMFGYKIYIVFCLISSYFGFTLIFKIMKEEITLIGSVVSFFMQIKSARIFILALFGRRSLICCAYQWTGVYMIGMSIMKELIAS